MVKEKIYREDLWNTITNDWYIFHMISKNDIWSFVVDMCNNYPSKENDTECV